MRVFAAVNCRTDAPYWVTRDVFLQYFDQSDFESRNVIDVEQAYLSTWFYRRDDGSRMFYIPVVGAIGSRTDLISSRHRLAVLLPHLEEVPFAFALGHLEGEELDFINSIPKRRMDLSASFWIPDLPIRDHLP